ncbi:hypothetical protein [Natrarchaeobaculum aegyptiacum]|uniref:DUF5673 domain-containing protein n=1 Tax=Natrarchaeobaculum aegyptiacum TaxID=745377 RepID=A0A2Z2HQ13_9EURY|nr:hypothetical protein [Natrarchaeobaculum aegyptiacum]ARS89186.1 hypothetical protein B1756_05110 [Natrarchaeobaculum aegyptiacum]
MDVAEDPFDSSLDGDDTVQWRRDASNSWTVRLLWSLGVGTFLAMISIVVFWRFYDIARQTDAGIAVLAVLALVALTLLVLAVVPSAPRRLANRLSVERVSERGLDRISHAAAGTLVMGLVIGLLMAAGRLAAHDGAFGEIGDGLFTGIAALSLPLALVALAFASFASSRGAIDCEEGVLYVDEPDQAIDLEYVVNASSREIGGATYVKLTYARPDNTYVPGPRRLMVPPEIARELERTVAQTS